MLRKEEPYEVSSENRDVVDDGETDTPLGVLRELDDRRQQTRAQLLQPDHLRVARMDSHSRH